MKLLKAMFPGNANIPSFDQLNDWQSLAGSIKNIEHVVPLFQDARLDNPREDINGLIKLVKRKNLSMVSAFLESSLEVYFTNPEVVRCITNSPVPLYPNERTLADFDYDLLEPVFMRSTEE